VFGPDAYAREVKIPVFYTGNLGGSVRAAFGDGACRGLLPCIELLERQRARYPQMLVLDCGNTLRGRHGNRLYGPERYLDAMRQGGYDFWLPGWRDWPLVAGGDSKVRLNQIALPVLAANVKSVREDAALNIMPYCIKQVDGVRIGMVGLAAESVPLAYVADETAMLDFNDPVDSLAPVMPFLRGDNTDVIVLVWDNGIAAPAVDYRGIRRVIRCFPEIDLVLFNGYHRPRRIGTAFCAGVPFDAAHAGLVTMIYDTTERAVSGFDSSMLPFRCGGEGAAATDVAEALARDRSRVVGVCTSRIVNAGNESGHSPAGLFLGEAVCHELQCDAAFFRWPMGRDIPQGTVTVADVIAAYPDNEVWGTIMLTPTELERAVRELTTRRGSDLELGWYGLDIQFDGDKPVITGPDGVSLHPRKRYTIALPEAVLASYGGVFPVLRELAQDPLTRYQATGVDNFQAVVNYMAKQEQ
jgi:2',3'-cyclic-nucleotide 2'-phosphodiesterase (5'-nucleotidase family)